MTIIDKEILEKHHYANDEIARMLDLHDADIVIGVDFDLTYADTLLNWIKWCNIELVANDLPTIDDPYEFIKEAGGGDLVPVFKAHGVKNPFAYWERADLVDHIDPMPNATNVLKQLIQDYNCVVVFVSKCVKSHIGSKVRMIEREFGKYWQRRQVLFVPSDTKYEIDVDIIIDDYPKVCKSFEEIGKPSICPPTPLTPEPFKLESKLIKIPMATYGSFWINVGAEYIYNHTIKGNRNGRD